MLSCENCEYKKRCERFKLTLGIPGKIGENIVVVTNLLIAKCVVQFFSPYYTSVSFRRMFQIEGTDRAISEPSGPDMIQYIHEKNSTLK
jgi:hypothetical protein